MGTRELLKDGAGLIIDAEQAVEVVTDLLADQGFAFGKPTLRQERAVDFAGDLRKIYDAVTEECTIDEVAANAALPQTRAASGLAELELEGPVIGVERTLAVKLTGYADTLLKPQTKHRTPRRTRVTGASERSRALP